MINSNAADAPLFAAAWEDSELNAVANPELDALRVGAHWRWRSPLWRLDLPPGPLLLEGAVGQVDLKRVAYRRASRLLRRTGSFRIGAEIGPALRQGTHDGALRDTFVVTDGQTFWPVSHITRGVQGRRLLVFQGAVPPPEEDLWIVSVRGAESAPRPSGVAGFAPGTPVETPDGPIAIERLRTGDLVLTDTGPRALRAVSRRQRTQAVAVPPSFFELDVPAHQVVMGPGTFLGVEGRALVELWGLDEALVCAKDLVALSGVRAVPEATLVSLIFSGAPLAMAGTLPFLAGPARAASLRCLTPAEAQIALAYEMSRCTRLVMRHVA